MKIYPFALVIALAGCQSSPQSQPMTEAERRTDQISRCSMMGAKTQEQMFQCRLALERDYQHTAVVRDQTRRASQSAALSNFGNAILAQQAMQQAMQQANRPRITTCNRLGTGIICNSN